VLELEGRGAIVAGTRRLGRGPVQRLVREGVQPAIIYRSSRDEAEELLASIKPDAPNACLVQADLTVEKDVVVAVETAKRELGDVSFCINLASDYPSTPFMSLDERAWERGLGAAKGSYLLALHAGRLMMGNTGPTRGHIILFGDWAAEATPYRDYLPYLTGKAAVHFLTRAFALELAPYGILVNAISPGPTMRPAELATPDWTEIVSDAPLARESSPLDIAELICTLLRLETVTGENIRVDSGRHLMGNAQ
jgi:NAD(P)-dependent dehydrogenase (short-subunit alcohol dehydrogenase family)